MERLLTENYFSHSANHQDNKVKKVVRFLTSGDDGK